MSRQPVFQVISSVSPHLPPPARDHQPQPDQQQRQVPPTPTPTPRDCGDPAPHLLPGRRPTGPRSALAGPLPLPPGPPPTTPLGRKLNLQKSPPSSKTTRSGSWRIGMTSLAIDLNVLAIRNVLVTEDTLTIHLNDGRTLGVPLSWYPRLQHATEAERRDFRISVSGHGIHWPGVDEDLSLAGLLAGQPSSPPSPYGLRWATGCRSLAGRRRPGTASSPRPGFSLPRRLPDVPAGHHGLDLNVQRVQHTPDPFQGRAVVLVAFVP